MDLFTGTRVSIGFIRCIFHLMIFNFHKNKEIIKADIRRWLFLEEKQYGIILGLVYLLTFYPEFRSLFYYRIGNYRFFLNVFYPARSSLIISTKTIGEGFYIQHGFATAIGAKSIGKNCWINQQVTIGYANETDCPVILDNVRIHSGAIIIGKITIGNNVTIGANATVYKDVPDNSTVVPEQSRIIRWRSKEVI